jgi:5-methyltetrahydropteroyltriglutamate--homocysteine methyltransferase
MNCPRRAGAGGSSGRATHVGDVALRDIVDLILRVPVGTYSLEQANPRHEHEWRVWVDVELPDGKVLMPGLISHATNVVEHPELVADRITCGWPSSSDPTG